MGKTNKARWERAKEALLNKGVEEEIINQKIATIDGNSKKFDALSDLLTENNIEIPTRKKAVRKTKKINNNITPTLEDIFGKEIAELLIKRHQLIAITTQNIDDIKDKKMEDLTIEQLQQIIKYKENIKSVNELKEINKSLEEKGINFVQPKKEEVS